MVKSHWHLFSSAFWLCTQRGPTQSNPAYCTQLAMPAKTAQVGRSCCLLQGRKQAHITSDYPASKHHAVRTNRHCCQRAAEGKTEPPLTSRIGSTAAAGGHRQGPGSLTARALGSYRMRATHHRMHDLQTWTTPMHTSRAEHI